MTTILKDRARSALGYSVSVRFPAPADRREIVVRNGLCITVDQRMLQSAVRRRPLVPDILRAHENSNLLNRTNIFLM
ncbi:hypothetical protein PUN28_013604 [Cardiocondyla obscurior]|uniref:Uncharacterized protein n=1 Tax=Cardiocondyla obscurior TaxID=286306 RepID=A0AAW2F5C5_9HYME